jgi:hypothetical protein
MATKAERFPKRFLAAADLNGKPVRLEIRREYVEELTDTAGKKKDKSILAFVGTDKELVLNATNFDSIIDITGEGDTEAWAGKKVELYPTTTHLGGKTVDCIRVRAPGQPEMKLVPSAPTPSAAKPELDDEIPF